MAAKTHELEHDIAAMESRLASVKVSVEVERDAWRKSYRTGKSGTKWKSAASSESSTVPTPPSTTDASSSSYNDEGSNAIMPAHWDALELAQHLQAQQLTAFAQVVISEQITGRVLLDAPPGRLRQLFQDVVASASDPNWKAFVHATSKLQRLQRRLDKLAAAAAACAPSAVSSSSHIHAGAPFDAQAMHSHGSSAAVAPIGFFPHIAPHLPIVASTCVTRASPSTVATKLGRDSKLRSPGIPQRKPPANNQLLATCWNCGARYPRPPPAIRTNSSDVAKTLSTRTFCSLACQRALESGDMSISAAASARLEVATARDAVASSKSSSNDTVARASTGRTPKPHKPKHHTSRSNRSGVQQHHSAATGVATTDALDDILHVGTRAAGDTNASRPMLPTSPTSSSRATGVRKRVQHSVAANTSASLPSVASIALSHATAISLVVASSSSSTHKGQQSVYRLDPALSQPHSVDFTTCFLNQTRNALLVRLQTFVSVQTLCHLSLVSRSWYATVHDSTLADALWGVHVLRLWHRNDDDDAFLYAIGAVSERPERPRLVLQRLTRHVSRVVRSNLKTLVQIETWQLATPMIDPPAVTLSTALQTARAKAPSDSQTISSTCRPARPTIAPDLYERIALVLNRKGEVVAVVAQELLRSLDDDTTVTDVLDGIRTGALHTIECRRLRLFSAANRLPFDRWHELTHCRSAAVCELYWSDRDSTATDAERVLARVWRQKVLERTQRALQQRLLAKESVQQLLRAIGERNGPPHALVALEQFLVACHASRAAARATTKVRKTEQLQHSPTQR